jgi:hypothetical protein
MSQNFRFQGFLDFRIAGKRLRTCTIKITQKFRQLDLLFFHVLSANYPTIMGVTFVVKILDAHDLVINEFFWTKGEFHKQHCDYRLSRTFLRADSSYRRWYSTVQTHIQPWWRFTPSTLVFWRFQLTRGLRCGFAAASLLGLQVRITCRGGD